jgi:hypothetical protein
VDPAEHQHVRPAVAVEVVHVGEHAVRLPLLRREQLDGEELVAAGEVGPLVPVRAGDDVRLAVAVEVADGDAVAQVDAVQDALLERDGGRRVGGRQTGGEGEEQGEGQEAKHHTSFICDPFRRPAGRR